MLVAARNDTRSVFFDYGSFLERCSPGISQFRRRGFTFILRYANCQPRSYTAGKYRIADYYRTGPGHPVTPAGGYTGYYFWTRHIFMWVFPWFRNSVLGFIRSSGYSDVLQLLQAIDT